jgi:putative glutamine amidotransferase
MDTRPRIGVTGDSRLLSPSWWCISLVLRSCGARPFRISTQNPAPDARFDGLVISGGNDIGPELYGGDAMPKARIDHQRDALEARWIRRALKHGWPILGICRGAQLLNAVLGGSLLQDVRSLRRHTSNRPSLLPTKTVALREESCLAEKVGATAVRVNSLHHQAILHPGDNLKVVGRDRDSICQAIESETGCAAMGVQWHPEYLFYQAAQRRIFRWLVEHAAR